MFNTFKDNKFFFGFSFFLVIKSYVNIIINLRLFQLRKTFSELPCMPLFYSYPEHFDAICDLLLKTHKGIWNLFVNKPRAMYCSISVLT